MKKRNLTIRDILPIANSGHKSSQPAIDLRKSEKKLVIRCVILSANVNMGFEP